MIDIVKILHLKGIKYRTVMYLVNKVFSGTSIKHFERKRRLLNSIGHKIGSGTKIVGPIECTGKLIVGTNCWIGKNLRVNGNGTVILGDNCEPVP